MVIVYEIYDLRGYRALSPIALHTSMTTEQNTIITFIYNLNNIIILIIISMTYFERQFQVLTAPDIESVIISAQTLKEGTINRK